LSYRGDDDVVTYSDRPWLAHYDDGVPATLAPYPDLVLHDFLRRAARVHPERDLLLSSVRGPGGRRIARTMTVADLNQASDAFAVALLGLGLVRGDRVAIVLPTSAPFAIVYYGILKAGAVVAACNPTYPAVKLAEQIGDCGARIVVTLRMFYPLVKSIQAQTLLRHVIVVDIEDYFGSFVRNAARLLRRRPGTGGARLAHGDLLLRTLLARHVGAVPGNTVNPEDLALFQYTGGTTGTPKAAMATHRALVTNMLQFQAWNRPVQRTDVAENVLGALPFFHVYGLVLVLSYSILDGARRIVLVPNPRDIDELVEVIDTYAPTRFAGVPALFAAIARHPRVQSGEVSLRSLQHTSSGSAPLPDVIKSAFEPLTGGRITEGFGMSETPCVVLAQPVAGEHRAGSVGLPLPDVDCRIVRPDDPATEMPVGEAGELLVAAPNLMQGYYNRPEESARAFVEHAGKRWLHTGDIARMDADGFFYIVDRKKDVVLIGGFNVYPTNVEKVLARHPAVLEVAVTGIPHPDRPGEETLQAWVVLRPQADAADAEFIEHCARELAPYEIPHRYARLDALPRSAVGKVLRRELVALAATRAASAR
jgi:long-chain acyl-CoA synthetase